METRGHEQIPFKEIPNPPLIETMKDNLEGFHPFTSEVMGAELPRKWKWPSLGKYNGTFDPEAHIKAYMTQANLFSRNMVVHCILFPTTLMEVTLEWYYSLPKNSIDSFNTLYAWFLARFPDCKPIVVKSASLHNVVQGEEEGLR